MVEISNKNNNKVVRVSVGGNTGNNPTITPNGDYSSYYSELSKAWAIKMDGMVSREDYSSKYYSTQAKANAETTENNLNSVISEHEQITNEITEARENISGDLAGALTDIATARDDGVAKVIETKTNSLSEIESAKTEVEQTIMTGLNDFNTNAQAKSDSLQTQFDSAMTDITLNKEQSMSAIDENRISSIEDISNTKTTAISDVSTAGAEQVSNIKKTGFYMQDDKLYYINSQGEETEFKSGGSGLEVCDIGMALYVDETKGLRRYLNGQIVDINTNTQAFLDRLKEITTLHPSLLCTEEEWQTAKTMSAFGQVGKFVFNYNGDKIASVRLPRVVNIQGLFDLQNLGMTVGAGLPTHTHTRGDMNITGGLTVYYTADAWGAFRTTATNNINRFPAGKGEGDVSTKTFDASRSWTGSTSAPDNPIYGNSTTVQQEAIQYPYFIQIATGSETENNIINDIELNNPYSLFDIKYSDHELNNLSWLKSEGQWNAKAVYPTAYDELLTEYNNSASVNKTEGSITFKRTPKGYKIALADQETAIDTKYTTDGIAWYYILDTTNEKFKLPRTKFGFEGLRTNVGDDIDESLPNITGDAGFTRNVSGDITGAFQPTSTNNTSVGGTGSTLTKASFNASRSSSTYKDGAPVQERATQMYLYFYVGETVQNANLIDAGRIGEQLATKTDMLQASGAGMPSIRYIDLTLGASGSTYTAPANGYFQLALLSGALIQFYNQTKASFWKASTSTGGAFAESIGCQAGDIIQCYHEYTTFRWFRFYYAEGSK